MKEAFIEWDVAIIRKVNGSSFIQVYLICNFVNE